MNQWLDLAAGAWVGVMRWADDPEFAQLTVADDGLAAMAFPGRLRFHLPVSAVRREGPRLRFEAGGIEFNGRIEGDGVQIAGRARSNDSEGEFWLMRTQSMAPDAYAALIGQYAAEAEVEGGIEGRTKVMLSQDQRPEGTLYWYEQDEQVVRLHPLGKPQFVSERCEVVRANQSSRQLTWQLPGEAARQFVRTEPYREEELRITLGDHVIAGTLLRPRGKGPHATVVLCHLADTHCRDYYRLFAAPFAEQGIAAFIYDKRGWGESTGAKLNSEVYALAEDAAGVFRFLQQQPGIRPEAVGLWGISNGAWVSVQAASQVGTSAFVIFVSGAGVTPARQEQVRRVNVASKLGASLRAQAVLDSFWEQYFDYAVNGGEWTEVLEQRLQGVWADEELRRLPPHPDHGPRLQPVPPRAPPEEYRARGGTWVDGGFDPAPLVAVLRCPVLAVWGEVETVIPLAESVERIGLALEQHGHPLNELHVVPGANHQLYVVTPEPENMLAESMHRLMHNVSVAPGIRAMMANWTVRCTQRIEPNHEP